jgi:3-deoxy-D-manno-octulosonate 8-phosphate phosphatase (KDO 8-P phosphatase)
VDRVVSGSQPGLRHLNTSEAVARASQIRLLLTDCDGVLTDGSVYCSANGEELLRFSRRDGLGFELLREAGIETAIVTREPSAITLRRADKLRVPLHAGIRDKRDFLLRLLREQRRPASQVAYIGDDVNDLPMLMEVAPHGLTAAPLDAEPSVAEAVHFVSGRLGGQGAFREFANFILTLRVGGAGLRPAEPIAGGFGDPLRVPKSMERGKP